MTTKEKDEMGKKNGEKAVEIEPTEGEKMLAQVMYEGFAHLAESVGLPTEEQAWLAAMGALLSRAPEGTSDEDSLLIMAGRADTVAAMYKERFLKDEGEDEPEPEVEKRKKPKSALDDGEEAPPITLPKRNPKVD